METLPAAAMNEVVDEPVSTVTETGTTMAGLLLDNETVAPPAGAIFESVTVHPAVADTVMVVGAHDTEVMAEGAVRESVALCETPLSVAVTLAV